MSLEKGYYNIPDSMSNIKVNTVAKRGGRRAQSQGMHREQDLTHWLSERTCVVIESWVHLFNASIPLGVFSTGSRFEEHIKKHNVFAIRLFLRAIMEQKTNLI